jgi:uncharacterized membrane protein
MLNNAELKSNAKSLLQGKWGAAALTAFVMFVILVTASSFALGALIIGGPMTLGFVLYLREIKNGNNPKLETLFSGFSVSFLNSMLADIIIGLAVAFGLVFLIVPGIIIALGFAMTFFIIADDPNISALDAMGLSWKMMKGHKRQLLCLIMRFFGWLLLIIVTFGIASFWVSPYIQLSFMNFYDQLKAEQATSESHES